jgi:hypothetical protein
VNPYQSAHAADNGDTDAFVTKFSADGSSLVYSTYLGGNSNDEALGIGLDSSGSAYVAGITYSSNFPTTPGAYETTYSAAEGRRKLSHEIQSQRREFSVLDPAPRGSSGRDRGQ